MIAAFDPTLASENGAFLDDGVVHNELVTEFGRSEENVDRLWELSEKLPGIQF